MNLSSLHVALSLLLLLPACSDSGGGGAGGGGAGGSGAGGSGGGGGAGGSGGGASGTGELLFAASSGQHNPWSIAIDDANIYFTNAISPTGSVMSVPKAGGPATVVASDQSGPIALAVNATHVYWANDGAGEVVQAPLAGGAPALVATSNLSQYSAIALDATDLYWTTYWSDGEVLKAPLAGGAPTTLATGQGYPAGITRDGTDVYWTNLDGEVMKVPASGGATTVIASGQSAPRLGVTVLGSDLYWLNEGAGDAMTIMTAPASGGAPAMVAQWTGASTQSNLVTDGAHFYVGLPYCEIGKAPVGGGAATTIQVDPALGCPRFLAIDATSLYFTSDAGVAKIPK